MTLLQEAFQKCATQLQRIVYAYKRQLKTKVWRSNGTYDEYEIVGELGQNSISNKNNVVKVEIGNKVTSIGTYAFQHCSKLTSITIPDSVTSIGYYAFYGCSGLTSVTIPDSVTSIEAGAFIDCTSLFDTSTIPGVQLVDGWVVGHEITLAGELDLTGIRGIGDSAFLGCSGLTTVTIPNGVASIGDSAFSGCSGLTSVAIPDSVTSIGGGAFYNTSIMNTYMTTKSSAVVQAMDYYPWSLHAGGIIHCSDTDLVVPESGGSGY